MKKLILIDGHSILFRAFYGMPPSMTAPDGSPTNAVYGFLTILNKVIETEQPDDLACAFDLSAPTFRHKMYPDYKGNRTAAPEEFHSQVPLIQKVLKDMGIPVVTAEGWEADDVLGTLASQAEKEGYRVVIISGDRDLLQLADEGTEIVIPKTRKGETTYERYSPETVEETYGVSPKKFIELKALMGDTSDNVPGLPGVGPKTAEKILKEFGSIESAREHADEIKPKKASESMKQHGDLLDMSLDLVTIRKNAPVEFREEEFKVQNIYNEKTYEDFKQLGFKSLLKNFGENQQKKVQLPEAGVIRSRSAAEEIFQKAAEYQRKSSAGADAVKECIGISALWEDQRLYAAGLSLPKEEYVFLPGKELSEEYLKDRYAGLMKNGSCIAALDVKNLLKFAPSNDEGKLFDPVIAAYLIDPLKSDWEVSSVASAYLHLTLKSGEELIGKKGLKHASLQENAEQSFALLAEEESYTARKAAPLLYEELKKKEMLELFQKVEMPLTYVLSDMEQAGILASREALKEYADQLSSRIEELTRSIYEEAGEVFNINSPKQLGYILFEKMHLKGGKKTKTGYSTAASVLEKLAPDVPMVQNILEYRTLTKLKSTYADALGDYIKEDGRIHTIFHQTVTATGRLSSSDPNLQNIPMRTELGRSIRKCFPPKEGCVFVDADYSQIELRILAHMSGDEKLIEAYREAKDIHRSTAAQVFHVPFEEVTAEQRSNAKAVNFGIIYGISSFGLSQGLSISRKDAQKYIDQYFETYPKIKSFLDGLVESAKEKGYAVSLFGRRRPIPELHSSNYMQRSFGERVAMNSPIQGTAADIIKIAMVRVFRALKKENMKSRLILQIHDELLIESPEEEAEKARELLMREMKNAASLKVSLETDCHIGKNWYEAK